MSQVGGQPTRFRYTKVEPQTFGLSPAEILTATDAELNTYMGIKKYAPYRKEGKGRHWDAKRGARLQELKAKLKERGVDGRLARSDAEGGEKVKKRKGKKERMREKAAATADGEGEAEDGGDEDDVVLTRDKKRKREERVKDEEGEAHDEGDKSKKKRRRHHKKSDVVAS